MSDFDLGDIDAALASSLTDGLDDVEKLLHSFVGV